MTCGKLLREEIEAAKALGYTGKIAVHPSQISMINRLFSPTEAELEKAKAIIASLASPDLPTAIASIDGEMVGPPFEVLARKLLATQELVLNKNNKGAI